MVIVSERDGIDSVRFVIEMGIFGDDDVTIVAVAVVVVAIGIKVVPIEVVVVVVVGVTVMAATTSPAESIDDVGADDGTAVVVVVVDVTACDSLISIFCLGNVVNIDVTDDTNADDSCAVIVVVAMDDNDDVNDGCLTSNVG